MQIYAPPIFPRRVLYYWAGLFGQQLQEGQAYSELRETISISFVNNVLFPQVPDFYLDFQLRSSKHPELIFCPVQSMHAVELPKFRKKTVAEIAVDAVR